jgi:N-acetylneuraminic acid mutarotase
MSIRNRSLSTIFFFACSFGIALGQQPIDNWPAPLLWSAPARAVSKGEVSPSSVEAVETVPTAPLHFVGISPCRIVDTRGNGFTGQYGPPALPGGAPRNFVLAGQCGISPTAQAVSLNVTVTNTTGPGFILIYPQGGAQPSVSTLNYVANQTVANAAVVPLGTSGGITVIAGVSGTDLILDTNGDYEAGVVTSVTPGTGLAGGGTGAVTVGIAAGGVSSTELASGAVTSSKIGANAVTAGAIAPGQVVKDVNGLHDSVTVAGSGVVTVNTLGSTITVGGGGTPSGSFLLGNPGDATLVSAGYAELGPSSVDSWLATTTTGAPDARRYHTAVWTGSKMIVWGGFGGATPLNTGGQYDPVANSWTATATTTGVPTARYAHTAVWTGSKMIVWGGFDNATTYFNTGGQYDPVGNSWAATTTTSAPAGRDNHTAVWTGSKMVVWGGFDGVTPVLNTGGRYDPSGDSWLATNTVNAPTARTGHAAIWTGSRMVVWGGGSNTNTGGQYDPVGDAWMVSGTTTTNAPAGRIFHSAIWTGTRMIVWGGNDGVSYVNTGGQYDPVGDSWSATTTTGAPTGRRSHIAVWTGARMIVWGGDSGSTFFNTGGQYDPAGDSWTATTTIGAPIPRTVLAAVWTGTRMIVWGGYGPQVFPGNLNTGGRYQNLSLYVKN